MSGSGPTAKAGPVWTYEDGRTRIVINRTWCKGCEVCAAFCPKKTLAMENDKAVVAAIEGCSRCMLCEIRCPDFAIQVFDLSPAKGKATAVPLPAEAPPPRIEEPTTTADVEGPDRCYGCDADENRAAAPTPGKGRKKKG